ncbi:MAG TPA: nucleotidyltransferase family protein [Pyrinomonadaceae bacterium]|jgi:CTP:molybdopterin cytidylyltransferase MocA|nr:nucleotidyltransferase family protein [Pyrinomonadaceae bacterium]
MIKPEDNPKSQGQNSKSKDQSPKTAAVAALILAAGRSQRMGAFKPLLPFGPTTVVESCIDNMRRGGVENVVVVVGKGERGEELKALLVDSDVSFAINPDPESEMSASIACGVRVLRKEIRAVVVNPVDHAAVPGEVVATLLYGWQQGAQLVQPTWNERGGHPVLIDLKFRDELLDLDPNNGLKGLFSEHRDQVKRVPVNSKYIARDMDTWDDYAALHQEVFGDAAPELLRKGV